MEEPVSYTQLYQQFTALDSPSGVADTNGRAFQDQLDLVLRALRQGLAQRSRDGVLSENERVFELRNTQLYAFCLEYFLAMLLPKQTFFQQPKDDVRNANNDQQRNLMLRVRVLREADACFSQFLDRAEQSGLLTEKKRRDQYERIESKQFSLSRDEKIQRFQLQREMETKLALLQQRKQQNKKSDAAAQDDEEDDDMDDDMDDIEREQLFAFLQLAVLKSMEEQASLSQEREMLETMLTMNEATDKKDLFTDAHRPPPPPQGQGITVTHINPQFEMRKETIRSQVFQPGHRLPTMSLNEYADRELADAQDRQKREQESEGGPRRYDQLVEDGDEDKHDLVDVATYKDRAWDDWKDANERGIGNKKGSQF